jgi:hypothetical protein
MKQDEPQSNLDWTPGDMFRESAKVSDQLDSDGGISIGVITRNDNYTTFCRISGLRLSEAIALLDIQKTRLLNMLTAAQDDDGSGDYTARTKPSA